MDNVRTYIKNLAHTPVNILLVGANPRADDYGYRTTYNYFSSWNNVLLFTGSADKPNTINPHLFIDIRLSPTIDALLPAYESFFHLVIIDILVFCHTLDHRTPNPQIMFYPIIKNDGFIITEQYSYNSPHMDIYNRRNTFVGNNNFELTPNLLIMLFEDPLITACPEYNIYKSRCDQIKNNIYDKLVNEGNKTPIYEDILLEINKMQINYPLATYRARANLIVKRKLGRLYRRVIFYEGDYISCGFHIQQLICRK